MAPNVVVRARARRAFTGTLVLALALTSSLGCSASHNGGARSASGSISGSISGSQEGAMLPDVVVSDLDGKPVHLRSLIGTALVINYWYSSCPPCREEMPALGLVAGEFSDQVRFVGINPQDDAATARRVATERGTTYTQLLDRTQRSVDALSLSGFPTTVLVASDGTIRRTVRRAVTADEIRTMIRNEFGQ